MVEKKRKVSARELDYNNKAKQAKNYVVSTRQTIARGQGEAQIKLRRSKEGRDEHGKLSLQPVRTKLANNIS